MAKLVLAFEGKIIRSIPLEQAELSVGRNPACDIQVDSLKVADRHARIRREEQGQYRLVAESEKAALLVNHAPATDHLLTHGDIIQLGAYSLTFADDPLDFIHATGTFEPEPKASTPGEERPPQAYLQVTNGPLLGRVIPLKRSLTRIGHVGSDIAVVAHRHDGYYISHLEGPHPPQIGGKSVGDQAVLLKEGVVIKVGALKLEFHVE